MLKLSRAALVHRRNMDINRSPDYYWVLTLLITDRSVENTNSPSKQIQKDRDHDASQGCHRDILAPLFLSVPCSLVKHLAKHFGT